MAKAKKRTAKKTLKKKVKKQAKKQTKKQTKKKPAKKASAKKVNKKTSGKKAAPRPPKNKPAKKKAVTKKITAPKPVGNKKTVNLEKLISPLADRLVVRVEGPSEKTAGGLFIPGTVSERPNQGEVLACGPGLKNKKGHLKPLDVKVGDKVLFNSYAGINAQIEGQDVLILREEEVLGVLSTM